MGSIVITAVWFTPNSSTSRINITISGQPISTNLNVLIGTNSVLDSVRSFISSGITTFLTAGYYNTNTDQLIVINSSDNSYVLAKVSGTVPPSPTLVLTSITISPLSASVNINGTISLTAICKDQNGNAMACSMLTWISSVPTKAMVSSSGSAVGIVTGVAIGTTTITASVGAISAISVITVVASVADTTQTWYCDPLYKICSLQTGTTGYATRDLCYKDALCGGTGTGTGREACNDPLKIGCIFGIPITHIAGLGAIVYMVMKKKT